MYFNILKKDLKRKKTMNVILLLFIILASMFVSSSVNSIVTVTTALDGYFEEAGVPDMCAFMLDSRNDTIGDMLDKSENIKDYSKEEFIYVASNNIKKDNELIDAIQNIVLYQSTDQLKMNYFDENNNIIKNVNKGEVYVSAKVLSDSDVSIGDTITVESNNNKAVELKVKGGIKDALLGSTLMGSVRILVNPDDYQKFYDMGGDTSYKGSLYLMNSDNIQKLKSELSQNDSNIAFMGDKAMIRMSYVMDMVVSCILLVISLCLIIVSFVALRFTIGFTISEEFREIGVMKAIGISNFKIRTLYLVKYFAMSVAGAFVGLILSIPFGNLLLNLVSDSVIMNSDNKIYINILCSAAVVLIILLFCFSCTGKTKKFSPVDAVRSGQTGERFRRKGIIHLGKSRMKNSSFMAVNDVLSSPKRYSIIAIVFALCLLMVQILAITADTLRSGQHVALFGMTESDVYITIPDKQMRYIAPDGRELLQHDIEEMEKNLDNNGMAGKIAFELQYKLSVSFGENICKSVAMQGIGTTAGQYSYTEGTPPQSADEIAITKNTAQQLGADIGDTVTINVGSDKKDYMITAFFQSMNNLGEGIRFHESETIPFELLNGSCSYQINFNNDTDEEELQNRIDRLNDMYPDATSVNTAAQVVAETTGVADTILLVKNMVMIVSAMIVILIAVLMERSMIAKEIGQIAVLKAIGFRNSSIIMWHTKRFVITSVVAGIIAVLIAKPVTQVVINPVFSMMGASEGVEYNVNIPEVYLVYPLMLIAVMALSTLLTSLYTSKITASQTADIE